MPMLSLWSKLGYRMEDYPNTYALYANEITLPLYNGLRDDQIDEVIRVVAAAVAATDTGATA